MNELISFSFLFTLCMFSGFCVVCINVTSFIMYLWRGMEMENFGTLLKTLYWKVCLKKIGKLRRKKNNEAWKSPVCWLIGFNVVLSVAFVFSFWKHRFCPSLTKGTAFESKQRKGANAKFALPQRRHPLSIWKRLS